MSSKLVMYTAGAASGIWSAALVLALVAGVSADTFTEPSLPAIVGVPTQYHPPFWYEEVPGSGNYTGFLSPLIQHLCQAASLDCRLKYLPALKDYIPSVVNGTVDFVVDILSVTAARAELVHFVYPGFYSAGVTLYATPTDASLLEGAGGWDELAGTPICFESGYYATEELVQQYHVVPVELGTLQDAVQAVLDGNCSALAYDTGQPALGLVEAAGVQPALNAPYAVPVQKNNTALRRRLAAATIELMSSGNESPLLQWEQQYLTAEGVLSNPNLYKVVQAVTYFQ